MPHERFFIDHSLEEGTTVALKELEFHHLCHVMRARIGDRLELVNGHNQLAQASLSSLNKHSAELAIASVVEVAPPRRKLILAQAIPRMNRLEYILEKGTELGVTDFWLFPGLLSEKEVFSDNQKKRMEQITISAMKQCGRLDLPTLIFRPSLKEWEQPEGVLFFGDTDPHARPLWEMKVETDTKPFILFIGPEKGFDPREALFLKDSWQAHGVKLHSNILRTDTAPLVGLSLLQILN